MNGIDIAPLFDRLCVAMPLESLKRLVTDLEGDEKPAIRLVKQTAEKHLQERLQQNEQTALV